MIYQQSVTAQPFRQCDETNLGQSQFCNFEANVQNPKIWGSQVEIQLNYTIDKNFSSTRYIDKRLLNETAFTNIDRQYDAFENDIAVLQVFFDSPTVVQFTTSHSKTWLDFISAVGGNVGLFIGFSIVTVVEFVWILMRIFYICITSGVGHSKTSHQNSLTPVQTIKNQKNFNH